MNSLRSMREQTLLNRQKAKIELLKKIKVALFIHAEADNYLAEVVRELNEEGVRTLTGKAWTTRNLWQFLTTNGEILSDVKAPAEKPEASNNREAVLQKDVPPDLLQLVEWAMNYKKLGVVPLAIHDPSLLERVEKRLELENLSFSGLVHDLLTRWLAKKEQRIPEQKKLPHPPICMSLLRNSGEHVVITMSHSQEKSP